MFFDGKEIRRIILNYRVKCEHEENLCLFTCIFKIGTIETVELICLILMKKIEKNLQSTFGY